MLYLSPSKCTSIFFFHIHFPSLAFSSVCSLDLSSPGLLISSFFSPHIICFLSDSHSTSLLSFFPHCLSFPKPSPMCSHFLFHGCHPSYLLISVFPPSSSLSIISTMPFFSNSRLLHLFLHFPLPAKLLQSQLCGSNPAPLGPRHLIKVSETGIPPLHFDLWIDGTHNSKPTALSTMARNSPAARKPKIRPWQL